MTSDPQAILNAIKLAYGKSSFTTRYNAMQAFLAVKQESSESVPAFISHAREALHFFQSTCPPAAPLASCPASSDPVYLLKDSDHELLLQGNESLTSTPESSDEEPAGLDADTAVHLTNCAANHALSEQELNSAHSSCIHNLTICYPNCDI